MQVVGAGGASVGRVRRPIKWDECKAKALDLVFSGRKSQDEIAQLCTVPSRTLKDWIAHPDFQAELAKRRENIVASLDSLPYLRKERRLIALAEMAESARQEYEAHPLLKEIRPTADGEIVNESFNRDAHAAFRDSLNDIAKELGERTNNVKLSGTVQHGVLPAVEDMTLLRALRQRFMDRPEVLDEIAVALAAPVVTEETER